MDEGASTLWMQGDLNAACDHLALAIEDAAAGSGAGWWLVTSVIDTSDRPLSYSTVRSIFSPQERLQQTLDTIQSIKSYAPASIVIVEMSGFQDWDRCLQGIDDVSVVCVSRGSAIAAAADSPHKGLAEALTLASASRTNAGSSGFWKLSGRYEIRPPWLPASSLRTGLLGNYGSEVLNTTCLGIGADVASLLSTGLIDSLPKLQEGQSIESVLSSFARTHGCEARSRLRVTGRVAVNGELVEF